VAFWQATEESDVPLADALANVVGAAQRLVTEHMEHFRGEVREDLRIIVVLLVMCVAAIAALSVALIAGVVALAVVLAGVIPYEVTFGAAAGVLISAAAIFYLAAARRLRAIREHSTARNAVLPGRTSSEAPVKELQGVVA